MWQTSLPYPNLFTTIKEPFNTDILANKQLLQKPETALAV
jgi:uncharacterized protein YqcC (DUF446 family)